MAGILVIPVEILDRIVEYLDSRSCLQLQRSCNFFRNYLGRRLWSVVKLHFDNRKLFLKSFCGKHLIEKKKEDIERYTNIRKRNVPLFIKQTLTGSFETMGSFFKEIHFIDQQLPFFNSREQNLKSFLSAPLSFLKPVILMAHQKRAEKIACYLPLLSPENFPNLRIIKIFFPTDNSHISIENLSKFLERFGETHRAKTEVWITDRCYYFQYRNELSIHYITYLYLTLREASILLPKINLPGNLTSLILASPTDCTIQANHIQRILQCCFYLKTLKLFRVDVLCSDETHWLPRSLESFHLEFRSINNDPWQIYYNYHQNLQKIASSEKFNYQPMYDKVKNLTLNLSSHTQCFQYLQFSSLKNLVVNNHQPILDRSSAILENNPQLEEVLYHNISNSSLELVGQFCSKLKVLWLGGQLGPNFLKDLKTISCNNQNLRLLHLSFELKDPDLKAVLKFFASNCCHLTRIYISVNEPLEYHYLEPCSSIEYVEKGYVAQLLREYHYTIDLKELMTPQDRFQV